jgi:hypothetical protein
LDRRSTILRTPVRTAAAFGPAPAMMLSKGWRRGAD